VSYLGVRLRPGVAGVLFGLAASEMTDQRIALAELWPDSDALFDALARAQDTSARTRTLSGAVARRLLAAPVGPPASVIAAAERIVAARGNLSIGALAADLGVTRQHLARSFARHVGLSPKTLARVVRARHVVRRLRRGRDAEWIDLALDVGYYDQSHLIAELKELTGLSPSDWAAARS
jgi:AraC-like DNA-binding protein